MASSPSPDSSTPSAVPPAAATTPPPSASTTPPPSASTTPPPAAASTPPPSAVTTPPPPAAGATPPPSSPPLETPSQIKANPPDTASPPPSPPTAPPPQTPPSPPTAPPPDQPVSPPTTTPPPESPPPPPVTVSPPPTTPGPVTPTPSPPPPTVTPSPPSDPPSSPPPPVNPAPPVSSPPPPSSKPTPTVPPPESPPPPPKPTPSPVPPPPESTTPPPPSTPTKSPPPSKVSPPPPTSSSKSPPPVQPSSPPASPTAPSNATTSPPPPGPTLVSPPSTPPASNAPSPVANLTDRGSSSGLGTGGEIAIGITAALIVLSIALFAFWFTKKRRRKATGLGGIYVVPSNNSLSTSSPKPDSSPKKSHPSAPLLGNSSSSDVGHSPRQPSGLGNSRPWFTYEELMEVTNGFSSQNLLGEGGFGLVFKGNLPDGREIAVKQLKVGGSQGEREFKSEVEIISRIHHRHLVSLVGYCIADRQRLLVYEYVPNNTLYFHLHGEGRPVLEWEKRVKIAAGAARGLAYLHEDCHPRVFHRDIKSSNILLDNNFEARVSDFGLAKLVLDSNAQVTTRVMGTFGYMAPEYALSGKLTEKSDVYSFGVVILELITGRKPVDTLQPLGDESLVEWARPLLSHALDNEEFEGLADPRLDKNYVESEMFRMIEVAAACVRHSAAKRPRMGQVVRAFDNLATADLTNGMKVGESAVFNSAEQSAEIKLFRRMAFGNQDYSTDYFSRTSSNI